MSSLSASSMSSKASSSTGPPCTHSPTSTEYWIHEPFESYKLKIQTLCQSIGFGETVVEWMDGGSFNRISKLTLVSGEECVLRVPRDQYPGLAALAQNLKDQIGVISYVATLFPVPRILAYDISTNNAIESPYIIQKFSPGQSLTEVFRGGPTTEDCFQISSIIADILVRMERVSFCTPGRPVTGSEIPDRCDDFSQLSTSMVIAPFKISDGEVIKSTSSPSVADFIGSILDKNYEKSLINEPYMVSRWERLLEIKREMQSKGLLTCQKPVLWHWDFKPQNILVNRTHGNKWEVTAVLDWDGALSVPRVLTREPPIWLWQLNDHADQESNNSRLQLPRKLTSQERSVKQHFEDCLEGNIDIEDYRADAYGKGRWVRRLFAYLHEPFIDSVPWRKYEAYVKDWEAYCLEHTIAENSGNDPTRASVGKEDAKANQSTNDGQRNVGPITSWLYRAFKKIFMPRRSDA